MSRLFVLGASDPEMEQIASRVKEAGEKYTRATAGGRPVRPHEAYRADPPVVSAVTTALVAVECGGDHWWPMMIVDHHRPGDPGYGMPPRDYLEASSLGQVLELLGLEATPQDRLVAAADHCPAAAYQGLSPGVDPGDLARFRAASRAAFQGRDACEVLADVEAAMAAIRRSDRVMIRSSWARDLRALGVVPELPEAAMRMGEVILAEIPAPPGSPGEIKVVIQGAGEGTAPGTAPVEAFLGGWADGEGYSGLYGDPVRGFAGGYR